MNYEIQLNGFPVQIMLSQGREIPRVGCLGPVGTYTEEATNVLLNGHLGNLKVDFLKTNGEVIRRVDAGDYDIGVVPRENSTEGDVMEVLRELVHTRHLSILGETIIPIQHMLLGKPGQPVEEVYSHIQALGQCRAYLLSHYPDARQISTPSTADGAKQIEDKPNAVAIASRRVAEMSGLPIIAANIGDIGNNSTRFILVGIGETTPTGQDNTTVGFVPREDRIGMLADCLRLLAKYGINLNKIDSHPTGNPIGIFREYMMLANLDGHWKDPPVKSALMELETTYCAYLKIFGSYRKAEVPEGVREPGVLNGNL